MTASAPAPRPAEERATCERCGREYAPVRCPYGCPKCWVDQMARRVLGPRARYPRPIVEPFDPPGPEYDE